jgi:nickel/cobalt transporter (NicO) family protein
MRLVLALLLVLGVLGSTPTLADPFHKTAPRPPSEGAVEDPSPVSGFFTWLVERQHRLNDALADAFHDVESGGSRVALVLILGLAFFYGVLHAAGPGHGKTVVASYFVAHHARWTSGILMGSLISLIQGVSAIALVGTLAMVLRAKQIEILNRGTVVEFVSYGLIVVIGVWTFYRAATGELHHHDHPIEGGNRHQPADHHHKLDPRLILATGLTPCASAIIILLFALANSAFGLGVIAVTVLTIGMAVTISTIGVAAVLGRRALIAMIDKAGMETHRLERGLAMAAAVAIVGVSGLMMYDAWTRL